MNTIEICGTGISIKEYNGQRVVTFKDIDTVHQRSDGTARKRFNDNKGRFIENNDYVVINQPSEIRTLGLIRPQGGTPEQVILITESGYLILVKSFTDDLAWQVQRELVNTYFKFTSAMSADMIEERCRIKSRDLYMEWKKRIAVPLIDRLNRLLESENAKSTYVFIYNCMTRDYNLDLNVAREEYSKEYGLPLIECSVIDVICSDKKLRKIFVQVVTKNIKLIIKSQLDDLKRYSQQTNETLASIKEHSDEFEDYYLKTIATVKSNCLE